MKAIILGKTYKDTLSGFQGVAVGKAEYLTGCGQVCLQPKSTDITVMPKTEWFDWLKLEEVNGIPAVIIKNADIDPGCDVTPPVL